MKISDDFGTVAMTSHTFASGSHKGWFLPIGSTSPQGMRDAVGAAALLRGPGSRLKTLAPDSVVRGSVI